METWYNAVYIQSSSTHYDNDRKHRLGKDFNMQGSMYTESHVCEQKDFLKAFWSQVMSHQGYTED
jgi:hypothetical protein